MTLTVRLPDRVEQDLAEYCVRHGLSKSDVVKEALSRLLSESPRGSSAYDLGRDLFAPPPSGPEPLEDVARNSKRLLREHFRGSKRKPAK